MAKQTLFEKRTREEDQETLTECIKSWDDVTCAFNRIVTVGEVLEMLKERHPDELFSKIPVELMYPLGHGDYISQKIGSKTELEAVWSVGVKRVQAKVGWDEKSGIEIHISKRYFKIMIG